MQFLKEISRRMTARMVKAKCLYGSFTVDGCKLSIDKAWSPVIIVTAFRWELSI
jgi:hypothetical protein